MKVALEQAIDEAREMRREQASRIVVPEVGSNVGPGPGGRRRRQDQVSLKPGVAMRALRSGRPLIAATALAALLLACSSAPEPFPGSGPGGKPMRTATETAVGLPPAASPHIYPLNARGPRNVPGQGPDRYAWLESPDTPQVIQWVKSQNAIAQSHLSALPARAWFASRIRQLSNAERDGLPIRRAQRYFYLHKDAALPQSVLVVSAGAARTARVLFDPNTLSSGALTDFSPGVTGGLLAYAVSDAQGQRWHFRRTSDATDLSDTLPAVEGTGLAWGRDDVGVYYTRPVRLPDGGADAGARAAVYFHRIGTSSDGDLIAYQPGAHVTHVPDAQLSPDGHYLIVTLLEDSGRNAVELLDLRQPQGRPVHLFSAGVAHYGYLGAHGSELYFETTEQAPLGRIIAIDAGEPEGRRVVVPESDDVLQQATYVGGSFIACYVIEGHSTVRVFERTGRPRAEVSLPGFGSVAGFAGEEGDAETFFSYTDTLTAPAVLRLDLATLHSSAWHSPAQPFAPAEFTTEQDYYTSKDGTRVALYITHRRDVPRDGDRALLLYAGAGGPLSLAYRPQVQAWLERGGVYAEADLHAADYDLSDTRAVLENEQIAVDDLVAAAAYLAREHYTRAARLGVYGRRGGAALVAAALISHPELFGAALPAAGPSDMLLPKPMPGMPPPWRSGGGVAEQAPQLQALYGYPSAQGVRRGCYPPTLIVAAEHDELIAPWYGYKLGAALQSAQSCGNPVLVRSESAQEQTPRTQIDDLADQWSFLANWLGAASGASVPAAQ